MFDPLKRILVESFIGAIALGYLLAQAALYFGNIFVTPLANWITRQTFPEFTPRATTAPGFPFQTALPPLFSTVLLLLVWCLLLRWLYFTPPKTQAPESASELEEHS
jgi:hypothetical protein